MYEKNLTLSRLETTFLLVCTAFMTAAGLYAWLVCELMNDAGMRTSLTDNLSVYPLLFLFSLAGGSAGGALVSITLRRHGFLEISEPIKKIKPHPETTR